MSVPKGVRIGGRAKGTPNTKTKERLKAVETSGLTPLEFMLSTLRNDQLDLAIRMDAAFKAAPYVHPKLSSTEVKATVDLDAMVTEVQLTGPE